MKRINAYLNANLLFKNSSYLIASNGLLSFGGFIFWIFVARLYSADQIGVATSLIAIVNLVSSLSILGLSTGVLKFLPTSANKNALINSVLTLVALTALLFGSFVWLNIGTFSPPLGFISANPNFFVFFIIFTISASLNLLLEAILTAFRSTKYVLVKNFIQATIKLFLPFLFISFGAFGIFGSFYVGGVIALLVGGAFLYKMHGVFYKIGIHLQELKTVATLSFGMYITGIMASAPNFFIPILITNTLGPEQTAFYYIVATTISVLNMIPQAIAQNLIVEGSYSAMHIEAHLKKAFMLILAILVPCVTIMLLLGNLILLVFGDQYSLEGFMLLRILSLCSLIVGVNSVLSVILIVFKEVKSLILVHAINTLLLFGLSYYFIPRGIVGVGYATILSQVLLVFLYVVALSKHKKLYLLNKLI